MKEFGIKVAKILDTETAKTRKTGLVSEIVSPLSDNNQNEREGMLNKGKELLKKMATKGECGFDAEENIKSINVPFGSGSRSKKISFE